MRAALPAPVRGLALLGALACLALLGTRLALNMSFSQPLHLTTSGSEWESIYVVWRLIHGQDGFMDRTAIPYAASTYNWLFYNSYAVFTGALLKLLGLSEDFLPTVARLFTLGAVATILLASRRLFAQALRPVDGSAVLAGALAVLVAAGPLIGFWAFTVRADVWGLAFEVLAVLAFLALLPRSDMKAALALAVLGYLAWSFKQTNVAALVACGTVLLLRGRFRALAVAVVVAAGLMALTFALGTRQYMLDVMMVGFTVVRDVPRGVFNLAMFAAKNGPTLLVAPVALVVAARLGGLRRLWADDMLLAAAAGVLATLAVSLATVFHTGSGDNYFFPLSFYLALLSARALGLCPRVPPVLSLVLAAGWLSVALAVLAPLTGKLGTVDLSGQHAKASEGRACLMDMPRPVLAPESLYLMLPWMLPGNDQPWVISFQYKDERKHGVQFEQGGLGELARRGHFATIAMSQGFDIDQLDGVPLDNYRLVPTPACPGLQVLVRRDLPQGR